MTAVAERIRDEALGLPEADRADLAQLLLTSLGEPDDPKTEAAWEAEIQRRIKTIESGESKGIPVEDVLRESQSSIRERVGHLQGGAKSVRRVAIGHSMP